MPDSEIAQNLFVFRRDDTPGIETARPEARLVERVCNGEEQAFAEIYKMFAPMVHGIVLSRVPHDDVQDIVQEVFLTAFRNINSLRERNALGAWLARIARNSAIEFYRRSKPTEELTEEISGQRWPDAEAREVLDAIRSLPETYRETLVLRLVEGMTGTEIADRTGLTPESVRVNLHRGRELLRQRLGIAGARK